MSEDFTYAQQSVLPGALPSGVSRRLSRDEMNLAEFPLTVLSTRSNPSLKTLEFSDVIKGKNGEVIDRKWIITGADKFGLPTASDDEVLLGLLKLTVDDGVRDRKIFFTRYELLRTLRWTTEGRSYVRLQRALDRLSGVRIKATNAFFDNESKAHSTKNFGILDAYEIHSGVEKPSFFTWSEAIFKSFQVGFIKKLDLDFYLDLQSSVSKRLYRFLDKHFWYKSKVAMNLFTLAHEKIGISRTYQYASSVRQILDPAIEELVKAGFLSGCDYIGKGKNIEVTLVAGKGKERQSEAQAKRALAVQREDSSIRDKIIEALVARGLKEQQVIRLIGGRSEETLARVGEIVEYFDSLVASGSRLVSKSPVGFLYRAVENPENFVLPREQKKQEQQTLFPPGGGVRTARANSYPTRASNDLGANSLELQSQYLVDRKQAVSNFRAGGNQAEIERFRGEVEVALTKLKALISPTRFIEAVEHGVEEKILKALEFPIFEQWCRRRQVN